MIRISFTIAALLFFTFFHFSCITTFEESDEATPRISRCDECHTYPGSKYCRTETITIDGVTKATGPGKIVTLCALCHLGAVKLDRTMTQIQTDSIDTLITIYHDKIITSESGVNHIATDSLHTDGKVDVNFAQCTKCHGYPPNTDGHELHVIDKKKKCTDCHLLSFSCSTYVLLDKTTYFPRKHKVPGKDSLFTPDPSKHLNGISGDLAFKQKEENLNNPDYDNSFIWSAKERSCENVKCHPPLHPEKHFWKKEAEK